MLIIAKFFNAVSWRGDHTHWEVTPVHARCPSEEVVSGAIDELVLENSSCPLQTHCQQSNTRSHVQHRTSKLSHSKYSQASQVQCSQASCTTSIVTCWCCASFSNIFSQRSQILIILSHVVQCSTKLFHQWFLLYSLNYCFLPTM